MPDREDLRDLPKPAAPTLSAADQELWRRVLAAGSKAQRLVPGAVAVGGTAAVLYAGHRLSADTDHVVQGLANRFDDLLETLQKNESWKTARVTRPVVILGSVDGVQVGFREPRRKAAIATVTMKTPGGDLVVPTLQEITAIKAYLAYSRNALRDYLDFAALTTCTSDDAVLETLMGLDRVYGDTQSASVRLEVAKALTAAKPFDLDRPDLSRYKGLAPEWRDWARTEGICRRFGVMLGQHLTR